VAALFDQYQGIPECAACERRRKHIACRARVRNAVAFEQQRVRREASGQIEVVA
jgi:hypothetical protein